MIRNYCRPIEMADHIELVSVDYDRDTGGASLRDLEAKLDGGTAAVYLENPTYLGLIDAACGEAAALARAAGAEVIVGADPISLGVLAAPSDYGADIAVGPTQPLGVHMFGGGGVGGYIASRDEERYVRQYNGFLVSIAETDREGEFGFGLACAHQNSYGMRELANDWTGNSVYLWAIANAVYMSLLGPEGFREVGELIVSRRRYAENLLSAIPGVRVQWPNRFHFKEFVVGFEGSQNSVAAVNARLREHGIFGGKDLSAEYPEFGAASLYCVTEVHSADDLERLATALGEAVR